MEIEFVVADYSNAQHGSDICALMDQYAQDPMGGAEPLSEYVKSHLVAALAEQTNAFSLLCYVDGKAAALANCMQGFSTFKCKPLLNIHDFMVAQQYRGLNLSQRLLEKVEEQARLRGCCKITLEVLTGNKPAQGSYQKFGFAAYELDPQMGKAEFWQKVLA